MHVIVLPTRFYSPRRLPIRYKVWHTTEGADSRTWLTQTGGVSSTYLIRGRDIYQLADEDLATWHAGRIVGTPTTLAYTGRWEDIYENGELLGGGWTINPNDESIGIEIEGFAGQAFSDDTKASILELGRDIDARHGRLPNVGHYELSPGDRSDPGVANLSWIKTALAVEDDMTPDQERKLDRVLALAEAREPLIWVARDQRGLDVETGKPYLATVGPQDPRIAAK